MTSLQATTPRITIARGGPKPTSDPDQGQLEHPEAPRCEGDRRSDVGDPVGNEQRYRVDPAPERAQENKEGGGVEEPVGTGKEDRLGELAAVRGELLEPATSWPKNLGRVPGLMKRSLAPMAFTKLMALSSPLVIKMTMPAMKAIRSSPRTATKRYATRKP